MVGISKNYLSVAITASSVKAALVSGGQVQKTAYESLAGSSREEMLGGLRTAIRKIGVKSAPVVCVIPGHMASAKNIEIPSTDPEEIESIINFPIPGQAKTVSVTVENAINDPNSSPMIVTIGIKMFFKRCTLITLLSATPLALANLI